MSWKLSMDITREDALALVIKDIISLPDNVLAEVLTRIEDSIYEFNVVREYSQQDEYGDPRQYREMPYIEDDNDD